MKKDTNQTSVSGALMVRHVFFDAIDTSSNPPFAKLFFFFKSHNRIGKAFIFNKNEGKVENKVLGRFREGFIVPIRWHNHFII